ncbi:glycerophosphodiester phosphodiesterase [bacterium]|nr:glycerophosphodiester phosphodiesterase [bacterium]
MKIAHRGASGAYPENTLAAFAAAVEQGADMVELDVHLSADSQLVVIHDETVDRTTGGSGAVGALTVAQMAALDAGGGQKIPTLAEVFALVRGRCNVNVELKGPGTAGPAAALIRLEVLGHAVPVDRFVVSSFDLDQLEQIKVIAPEIRRAPLYGDKLPEDYLAVAHALGAWSVNLNKGVITAGLVKRCHKQGFRVLVWTVDEPEEIARLKALGVDGIIGDYPDRL